MKSRRRDLPILGALIVGIGMIVAPFVFQMFERAPLGGDMIVDFEPYMTVEQVEQFRGYLVEIAGDPNLRLKLDIWPTDDDMANLTIAAMHSIGMRMTAVPVVNAIRAVCEAAPGIATYTDLPPITSHIVPTA